MALGSRKLSTGPHLQEQNFCVALTTTGKVEIADFIGMREAERKR